MPCAVGHESRSIRRHLSRQGGAYDVPSHQTTVLRADEAPGPLGEAHRQPLGEQLRRCRPAAERHHGAARRARLCQGADLRAQRPQREELIATNSMILHELYFDGLGGDGISGGAIDEALARDFGSVDRWRAEFVSTGKALRGGSGWVLLTYAHRDRRLVNQWAADHTHALAGGTPILALDMYEHSYQLDYGASAERYVDAFMENINWTNVAGLLQAQAPGEPASEFEVWGATR